MALSLQKRQLEFLQELFVLRDEAGLANFLIERLETLLPASNVIVGLERPSTREAVQIRLKHAFTAADFTNSLNESGAAKSHPIWERNGGSRFHAVSLSRMMSPRQWHEHPLYREFLRRDGVEDFLTISIPVDCDLSVMIGLIRDRRGFRDAEFEALRQLGPHLEQAFLNAGTFSRLGAVGAGSLPGSAVKVDPNRMPEVFRSRVPCWSALLGRDVLAEEAAFLNWSNVQIACLRRGTFESSLSRFDLQGPGGKIRLRLGRNWHGDGCLLLEEARRHTAHLTTREHEIAHWLGEGKSDAEIALILGLSIHTVKSYLKAIYRKLGVRNRTEAVQRMEPAAPATP